MIYEQVLSLINDFDGVVECVIMMYMMARIFKHKASMGKMIAIAAGVSVGFLVLNTFTILANEQFGLLSYSVRFVLYLIFIVLAGFIFAVLALKGNWRQFLITLLFYKTSVLFASFLYKMSESVWGSWITITWLNHLIRDLLGILIIFLVAELCQKFSRPISTKISEGYWLIAGMMPVCLTAIWIILGNSIQDSKIKMPLFNLLMLLVTFLGYALFSRLAVEMEKQMELNLNNQSLDFQMHQMNDAEKMLKQAKQTRHELKNNYFYIETLIEQEKYDEVHQFLDEVVWPELDRYETVTTGNKLVDMILSYKVAEARHKDIPIVLDVLLSEEIKMQKQLLCSLVSNLLDNAIEASIKVKEPDIFFSMHEVKGYLAIEVRNKIDESVLKKNPNLHTTKTDKIAHGIGMQVIRQITDYYDGNIEIVEQNGNFIVYIFLPVM